MLSKLKSLSKLKKILLIILSIIILLAATCGISYAVAPREFLQFILSDATYTKLMLANNLSTYYPAAEKLIEKLDEKQLGFDASGTIEAKFVDTAFGSKDITKSIETYVNTLEVDTTLNIDGALAQATCALSDKDGDVLNAICIADPANIYLDVKDFDLGYMSMIKNSETTQQDVGTINETYENIVAKSADKDLKEAVYDVAKTAVGTFDNTLITVIKEKTLNISSLSATGDVATVVMPIEDFKNCITTTFDKVSKDKETFDLINSCLPSSAQITYSKYQTIIDELKDKLIKKTIDSEITNVTLEFYINRKNEIVGLDIELIGEKTNIGICIILKDDRDRGFALDVKERTESTLLVDIVKTDDTCGTIHYSRETEDGPIAIKATYTDLELSEKAIFGHIQTDSFIMPGNEDLGKIKLDITISGQDESLSINADVSVEKFVDASISLYANTAEFKNFTLPKASDITPYDKQLLESAATAYILTEMPKDHPAVAKVYKEVLATTITGTVENAINDFLGDFDPGKDLVSAIVEIIDRALTKDSSHVDDVIDSFFSAFGLKKDSPIKYR